MKTFIKWLILLTAGLSILVPAIMKAQTMQKSPKVVEVESYLTGKAIEFIKGRFPMMPVLVTIKVMPLRRDMGGMIPPAQSPQIMLPFHAAPDMKVVDVWDDESKSVHDLMPRIQSVDMIVTLPSSVTSDELTELREALFSNLGLVLGRDNIKFELRPWVNKDGGIRTEYIVIAGSALVLFLLGIFLIIRNLSSQIRKGLLEVSSKAGGMGGTSQMPAQPITASRSEHGKDDDNRANMVFQDPVKLKEHAKPLILTLVSDPAFPRLQDILIFSEYLKTDPRIVTGAVKEFPIQIQNKIFSLTTGRQWLSVMFSKAQMGLQSWELLNSLTQNRKAALRLDFDELLTYLWRLENDVVEILRELGQWKALSILAYMPSSVSIRYGKMAFPGAWGKLLDPTFKPDLLPKEEVASIREMALKLKPLNDPKMLEYYEHERGLVEFLLSADTNEEKEVYEASGPDSFLKTIRPPFYVLFNQPMDVIGEIFPRFTLNDWTMALFNVPKDQRRNFEEIMNEKQKFLLFEGFKNLDKSKTFNKTEIGKVRETIAFALEEILLRRESEKTLEDSQASEEEQAERLKQQRAAHQPQAPKPVQSASAQQSPPQTVQTPAPGLVQKTAETQAATAPSAPPASRPAPTPPMAPAAPQTPQSAQTPRPPQAPVGAPRPPMAPQAPKPPQASQPIPPAQADGDKKPADSSADAKKPDENISDKDKSPSEADKEKENDTTLPKAG
ncbi:MAG: hypothetical protein HQK54_08230 [Oligoflexales bacterium]|nr:hypothetical protein [Oligoflexales bacterium]